MSLRVLLFGLSYFNYFMAGSLLSCIYFQPGYFLLNGNASSNSFFCNSIYLNPDLTRQWNNNLDVSETFLQLKYCISIRESSIMVNETCVDDIHFRFAMLKDRPMCCSVIESSDEYGCYSDVQHPCYRPETENSIMLYVCKNQLALYTECAVKGYKKSREMCKSWNNDVLPISHFTAGCYSRSSELTNISPGGGGGYDRDTFNFLARSFCATRNCCRSDGLGLCNAPLQPLASSATTRWTLASLDVSSLRRGLPSKEVGQNGDGATRQAAVIVAAVMASVVAAAGVAVAAVCCHSGAPLLRFLANKRRYLAQRLHGGGGGGGGGGRQPCAAAATVGDETQQLRPSQLELVELPLRQQQQQMVCDFSSSGAGNPNLVRRTIARETTILGPIGQGRFGQVFKGTWRTGDLVAVKMFHSRAESSWSREGEIYAIPGLPHPAILGFIAMDNLDAGWETQLWLITDYHSNGSLQAYLTEHAVTAEVAARMCHSLASGLAHLHAELLTSGSRKPGVAHCDVKSNNVLVRADLTCCLADFGLAVRQTDNLRRDGDRRVGTVRYQSPELLDGGVEAGSFAALKQADVYAMGLVMWEVGNRCCHGDYSLPYADSVGQNPGIEEMRRVVCPPASGRPPVPAEDWLASGAPAKAALASGLLADCWHPEPGRRLEAGAIKQRTAVLIGDWQLV